MEPQDLVKLHGLLIAFAWLAQNTGNTPLLRPGAVPCCYRITPAGRRALQLAGRPSNEDEEEASTLATSDQETAPRNKGEARIPKRRKGAPARAEVEQTTSTKEPDLTETTTALPSASPAAEEASVPGLVADAA